ncbi:MAG: hypothetical protein WCA04_15775 [Geobacteraceae bacterium]
MPLSNKSPTEFSPAKLRNYYRKQADRRAEGYQARAEAEALRLQKENVTTPLVKLRQIEATLKAIEKWDGHLSKVTSGVIPFIDVKNLDKE